MDAVYQSFIDELVQLSLRLRTTYAEILEDWSPSEPPVTTLFAALGDSIADDFKATEPDAKSRIFALIESAMASGDQRLVTAVATGLIEAIISRVAAKEEILEQITESMGVMSRKHAEAWIGK